MVRADGSEHLAQSCRIRCRLLRDGRQRPPQIRLTNMFGRISQEHESAGRRMSRQPTGGLRPVDDRIRRRHALDDEHLAFPQDAQLRVLTDELVHTHHVRPGHRSQIDGIGGAVRQLPHPDSDSDTPIGVALEQIVTHHLTDESVGRRLRQFGTFGDLVGAQALMVRVEGCEHAHESIDHRVAGRRVRHASDSSGSPSKFSMNGSAVASGGAGHYSDERCTTVPPRQRSEDRQ